MQNIKITHSNGLGKGGKMFVFIRPDFDCMNRSRRVGAYTSEELKEVVAKCIAKYYTPLKQYMVDGHIIGSNNEKNALREYWKVCDKNYVGKRFLVEEM